MTLLWLVLAGALAAPAAHAQTPNPTPEEAKAAAKAAAKVAAEKGEAHFKARRYEEAIAAFHDADQTFHAPTFVIMIARAHEKLGRLQEARALYQQVIDEQLAHYAPEVFFEAKADARRELQALMTRMPTLQVNVAGAPKEQVRVTIDGQPAALEQPLPQDVGPHRVTVSAPGRETATLAVTLQDGSKVELSLELKAPSTPPPAAGSFAPPAPRARVTPPEAAAGSARRYTLPSMLLLGFGALGLGISAITGAAAAAKADSLEILCPDRRCYKEAANTYASARMLSTASTISFAVGGVAATGGAGLLIWDLSSSSRPNQTGFVVGPGWAGAKGRF